jgi:hypothetical protein
VISFKIYTFIEKSYTTLFFTVVVIHADQKGEIIHFVLRKTTILTYTLNNLQIRCLDDDLNVCLKIL